MLTGILLLWLAAAPTPPPFVLDAPRSWSGVIPCADCEGIRLTVNLFPDQSCAVRNENLLAAPGTIGSEGHIGTTWISETARAM